MRHVWIFEMLADLRDFACLNNLPALAQQVEQTIEIARTELGEERGTLLTKDQASDGPKH